MNKILKLSERENIVVALRKEKATFKYIGDQIGVSMQRARMIYKEAEAKLSQNDILEKSNQLAERKPMTISPSALANLRILKAPKMFDAVPLSQVNIQNVFIIPEPPSGVVPSGSKTLAMDESPANVLYSTYAAQSAYSEGISFMGYQYLAQLMQRTEYSRAVQILAEEMTRKGIKIQATGEGEGKEDLIKEIEGEFTRLNVINQFRLGLEMDYTFGKGQLFIDYGSSDAENASELSANKNKILGKKIKRLHPVEPMWIYPDQYNAIDPLSSDFYQPSSWFVMSKRVHDSRFLKFVSHPVPDILKPAYLFGGVSLTQKMKPYVDNWLNTRQDVQQVIHSFITNTLKTNMAGALNDGVGLEESRRAEMFTIMKTNSDLHMIDKDTEDIEIHSAPLGSLDKLQAQAQEHVASSAGLPLVKYTGISPSGLNATSEFEMQCLNDHTAAEQEKDMRTNVQRILELVQLGLGYEVDPEITFDFVPLMEMTEKERAEITKANADSDAIYINSGVVSQEEVRGVLANREDSPYAGLDVSEVPDFPGMNTEEDLDKAMDAISMADLSEQVKKGLIVEMEHFETVGGDEIKILEIVLDHLKEDPEYYSNMEKAGME